MKSMADRSAATEPIIRIRGLGKRYGNHVVLRGIDFEVQPSQVVVVIGPSGSGKSTFLRCCNGLEQAEEGTVEIVGHTLVQDGRLLPEPALNALRTEVGMVFQSFNLFPHLSVLHNITLGPRMLRGLSPAQAEAQARELLQKVGLSAKAEAIFCNWFWASATSDEICAEMDEAVIWVLTSAMAKVPISLANWL